MRESTPTKMQQSDGTECPHESMNLAAVRAGEHPPIVFLDYPGIVFVPPNQIDRPQILEIPMVPATPGGANIICIYTGTALGTIQGQNNGDWNRTHLYVEVPTGNRVWSPSSSLPGFGTRFMGGVATASPSSMFNQNTAVNAGWAVDAAWMQVDPRPDGTGVMYLGAHVAVRDSDGFLYRVSYQITAIGLQ